MRQMMIVAGMGLALGGVGAGVASADLHTFNVNEVYSNASGTIQFIELDEVLGANGQHRFATSGIFPHTISSLTVPQTYTFPNDLPSTNTAFKKVLLGTAGYAALDGAVAPDYVIPSNFFTRVDDRITFSNVDFFDWNVGAYPTADSTFSLSDDGTTGPATPTNFAGQVGTVPEPSIVAALGGLGLTTIVLGRRSRRRERTTE